MFRTAQFRLLAAVTLVAVASGLATASPILPGTPAPDPADTRMLSQPAISATHVAFNYAGDLWSVRLDGSDVRRLTTHAGSESLPVFSPDGGWIAFSGEYDGNTDVFVVPTGGGEPRRLTWHPGADIVRDFTPDGSAVLFGSQRSVHTNRYFQLFTVSVDGGMPDKLPIPNAWKAAYSPDGSKIAYTPLGERMNQWKNYRGGTVSRIWIYDVADSSVQQVPQPEGRSNDTDPMWIGETLYFRSDRNGEFNVFSFDPSSSQVSQRTAHADFPVLSASSSVSEIVYEQAGWLYRYDPATDTTMGSRLAIGVPADLIERRPRWVSGSQYIRNGDISPSGSRAVVEFRGEIITVPAEKGTPRNLTRSADVHDRSPAWSPDGKSIAWFSDEGGEYQLRIIDQMGAEERRSIAVDGAGFYEDIHWSPDSKHIAYTDNSWGLFLVDVESGTTRKLATEPYYGPFKTISGSWSSDSGWIAYTQATEADFRRVWVYSLAENRSYPVTDGLSDAYSPVFDGSGKYLYFISSTDAGPVRQWFAMSNADMQATNNIYVAVLQKGVDSPFKAESDEEVVVDEPSAGDAGDTSDAADLEEESPGEESGGQPLIIDFDHLDQRIVAMPLDAAGYDSLEAGADGQIYYLRRDAAGGFGGFGPGSLRKYDLGSREETTLADGVLGYELSADGNKLLAVMPGGTWVIAGSSGEIDPSKGKLDVDAVRVRIDPVAEWQQIYREAWRINRDYFYDPNFHGADWDAMGEKYSEFLDHLTTRGDLNRVLQWMSSELSVGHHRNGGGDTLVQADRIPGGLLGADYEVANGRYRFAKVFGGLNWNPELRAPLTEPGVDAVAGEYLLAVNGLDLTSAENPHSRFENTTDQIVEITLGPNPTYEGSRTAQVVPIASEVALRNRDWVEGNIAKVDAATNGRVAYVYVPNTAGLGHTYFKRYFFPQAHKDAIIVDEFFNGGGQVADYYIDLLRRPYISHWATRYGQDFKTPVHSIQGPKVMLIDETAGSGGDLLPWMFHKLELGTLVGKRTWGGLVGTLGFPVLMDGGVITAPNLAIWTEDGFVVENVGVPPDVEVEQWPADVIAGRDPQLEKAIEIALAELEANPPYDPAKPAYPIRVRQ